MIVYFKSELESKFVTFFLTPCEGKHIIFFMKVNFKYLKKKQLFAMHAYTCNQLILVSNKLTRIIHCYEGQILDTSSSSSLCGIQSLSTCLI